MIFTDPKERTTALSIWAAVSGIGMVVWSLKQFGKEAQFDLPGVWVALGIALVTLTWFAIRSLRREHPLLDLRLFKSRAFSSGMVSAFGATFAMIAALLLISQWLLLVHGSTPIEAGIQLIPIASAGTVASLAAPPLARMVGPRAIQSIRLLIAGAGLLYIGAAGGALTLSSVIIGLCLVGGEMGALAIGTEFIMGGVPEDKAGNAGALQETAYEFSGTLGGHSVRKHRSRDLPKSTPSGSRLRPTPDVLTRNRSASTGLPGSSRVHRPGGRHAGTLRSGVRRIH